MDTTTEIKKFLFDRSFDAAQTRAPEPKEPPKPVFSEEQIAAAREEAYREGLSAGRAAAAQEQTALLNLVAEKITQQITDLLEKSENARRRQREETLDIALTIARKFLPAMVERHGYEEIQALVAQTLSETAYEPRLVIRVADANLDPLNAALAHLTRNAAFEGKIVLLAEPDMGASDCRIEWADGGIERDGNLLWQDIDRTAARAKGAFKAAPAKSSSDEHASSTTNVAV